MYVQQLGGYKLSGSTEALTSAAVIARHMFLLPANVKRLAFVITTATVSTGNIVITAKKYVTPGSASGAVTLDTLTIPTGVAAGTYYYKNVNPETYSFKRTEELVFEVTTAAAGMSGAGAGYSLFEADYDPENIKNDTDAVASA